MNKEEKLKLFDMMNEEWNVKQNIVLVTFNVGIMSFDIIFT